MTPIANQTPYLDHDTHAKYLLDSKKMDIDAGYIGKAFGTGANAQTNVLGLVILAIILFGIVPFFSPYIKFEDYWKVFSPILTTLIGVFVGKRMQGD